MKFAKVLRDQEVREWRAQYFDYRGAKKLVKQGNVAAFTEKLDGQLAKIETFYKQREDDATQRLTILRRQLHLMLALRDREVRHVLDADGVSIISASSSTVDASHDHTHVPNGASSSAAHPGPNGHANGTANGDANEHRSSWLPNVDRVISRAKIGHIGGTFKAMRTLASPQGSDDDLLRDYTRLPPSREVPYRVAKRKLEFALEEYYRSLFKVESFRKTNHTAFRKICKKFDKANKDAGGVGAKYMENKITDTAYFVTSSVIDDQIHTAEDIYARYFQRGQKKIAVMKLRERAKSSKDYSAATFWAGAMLFAGLALLIEGLIPAHEKLHDPDPKVATVTIFLLQLYGGFLLAILLGVLFSLAVLVWKRYRINYTLVFELDVRKDVLEWRQMLVIPSLLFFFLGLLVNLNFATGRTMYIWWPVIMTALVTGIIFNPLPMIYRSGRAFFIYSSGRLLLSGLVPVQFRDFFLGDLYCSQTYALGNLATFSCLYNQHPLWSDPKKCGSGHLWAVGFMMCLPSFWRICQCMRRYLETGLTYQLWNVGKYSCTILQYISLSAYRMHQYSFKLRAFFLAMAVVNTIYTSAWDLSTDWSLLVKNAKYPYLRHTLEFPSTIPYYAAILIDPILRGAPLLYGFYTTSTHAPLISFFVGFIEVLRRAGWMVFRVENEHCANVAKEKAWADAPLPYEQTTPLPPMPLANLEAQAMGSKERIGNAISRIGTRIHTGHTEDFVRRPDKDRKDNDSDTDDDDD